MQESVTHMIKENKAILKLFTFRFKNKLLCKNIIRRRGTNLERSRGSFTMKKHEPCSNHTLNKEMTKEIRVIQNCRFRRAVLIGVIPT